MDVGKCEYLVQRWLVGNEIERDELVTCRTQLISAQVQSSGDGGGAVVAQALGVGHRDQEQIQGCAARVTAINEMPLHQGLVNPTELLGDLAHLLRAQYMFYGLHHDSG